MDEFSADFNISSNSFTSRNDIDINSVYNDYENIDELNLSGLSSFIEKSYPRYSNNETFRNDISKTVSVSRKRKRKQRKPNNCIVRYRCTKCSEQFESFRELQVHRRKHIHQKPHKCDKCSESFNVWDNLQLHAATHISKTPAECPRCHVMFNRIASFHGHIQTHFKSEYFTCDVCQLTFNFEPMLKAHIAEKHPTRAPKIKSPRKAKPTETILEKKRHPCQLCGKRFQKPSGLVRHLLIHKGQRPYKCNECEYACNQKGTLENHKLTHTGEKPFACPKCPQHFVQRSNLSVHMKRVHPVDDTRLVSFPCSKCGCIFKKVGALHAHTKKIHNDVSNVRVDTNQVMAQLMELQPQSLVAAEKIADKLNNENQVGTGDQFIRLQDVAEDGSVVYRYVKKVIINEERILFCVFCNKSFRRPSDLLRHMRIHTKEKPFVCQICNRRFAIKSTLNNHMRVHTAKTSPDKDQISFPFSCQYCGQKLKTEHQLKIHLETHERQKLDDLSINIAFKEPIVFDQNGTVLTTTEDVQNETRLHQCKFCDASFKQSAHLKQHINSHLGIKSFECPTCKKLFGKNSTLQEHMLRHQPKKLKCNNCPSTFYKQSTLNNHQKTHTQRILCPYCHKAFKTKGSCKLHIKIHKYDLLKGVQFDSNQSEGVPENAECISYDLNESVQAIETSTALPEYDHKNAPDQHPDNFVILHPDVPQESCEDNVQCVFLVDYSDNPNEAGIVNQNCVIVQNSLENNLPHDHLIEDDNVMWIPPPNTIIPIQSQNDDINNHFSIDPKLLHNNCGERSVETQEMDKAYLEQSTKQVATLFADTPNNGIILNSVKHSKNRENRCHFCAKVFLKPIDLRRHLRRHTGERPFVCNICTKPFKLKCTLDSHMNTHMVPRDISKCHICAKSFTTRSGLKIHMTVHTGKRPYKCTFCELTFRTVGNRNSHQRVHSKVSTKQRPPPRVNVQQSNLMVLAKTVNDINFEINAATAETAVPVKKKSPYSCLTCLKTFEKKSSLTRHELTHTKERPFECSICHDRFNQKAILSNHMKIHSSVMPFGCEYCWQTFRLKGNLSKHLLVCKAKARIRDETSSIDMNQVS